MSRLHRLRVTELHPNLLCILCGGYYVDATTIVECLHSFCKTCIVRYLETSKFCPICDVQVHKTKPLLSIREDKTLQDIVYKLVPGLYQNEMCRRREFYAGHPETEPSTPEDGGTDFGRWYILPDDLMSVALHPTPHDDGDSSSKKILDSSKASYSKLKNWNDHIRYLQCPAGVSVAQLKRLLRAKFGVKNNHPLAVLASTSENPLRDHLTLVDVAYITSWQKTEPLKLHYKIFEKANKKMKLDQDNLNTSEFDDDNEDMPKLEPSVGNGVNISAYEAGNALEYKCAPLLKAYDHVATESETYPGKRVEPLAEKPNEKNFSQESESIGKKQSSDPNNIVSAAIEAASVKNTGCGAYGLLTQGSVSNSSETLLEVTPKNDSYNNIQSVTSGTSSSNIVDTYLSYNRTYPLASSGVGVGVTFIPSEVGFLNPTGVPCTILPSGGCVSVNGDCITGGINVPTVCSTVALQSHLESESSTANHLSVLVAPGPPQNVISEDLSLVPNVENRNSSGVSKEGGEEEGKEVQLTISESGIMSACGRGTTLEGVVNPFESEACELLSKIESGSLGEDILPKTLEKPTQKPKENEEVPIATNVKSESIDMVASQAHAMKFKVETEGDVDNKNQILLKEEKPNSAAVSNVNSANHKLNNLDHKDSVLTLDNQAEAGALPDSVGKNKLTDDVDKKFTAKSRKSNEKQCKSDAKIRNSDKSLKSTHIPASLTAASMANLNKPHLKGGPSKVGHPEESKNLETKASITGMNTKKEGKQESSGKLLPALGSCRKSSQPYGYKTLKTPPKSWNPTISREHLALGVGKSCKKSVQEYARPNKFFKARNNPQFGGSTVGIKPMNPGGNDSSNVQKQVVLKLDPKSLGPATSVPLSNDRRSSEGVTSSVSNLSSSISCTRLAAQPIVSAGRSSSSVLNSSIAVSSSSLSSETTSLEASSVAVVPKDAPVTSTNRAPSVSTSHKKFAKDRISPPKVIGKKDNAAVQNSKVSLDNKTSSNSNAVVVSKPNNSDKSKGILKHEHTSSVLSAVSDSKVDGVVKSNDVKDDKGSSVGSGQSLIAVGSMLINSNAAKSALSLGVPTCMTQLKTAPLNTLTASSGGYQPPQQPFGLGGSPTLGVISSDSMSLPATIGSMPLPYYSSQCVGYSTYPYVYQSPDANIGLIPPSASLISTFPSCLSPRSPMSPRKMLSELPLQTNLLPLVPLVPHMPPQALSPRPMTPPSPKTPLCNNQSSKPFSSPSVRQSSSTSSHSRPLTPHSPGTHGLGHTRSPAQSPKLSSTGQFGRCLSGVTMVSEAMTSSQSCNMTPKSSAYVQSSQSHTLMPRNNMNYISSPKLDNQSEISQQIASITNCYPSHPQSLKSTIPKVSQPSIPSSLVNCAVSSETVSITGTSTRPQPQTSQTPKCSNSQFSSISLPCPKSTSVNTPIMAATRQEQLQITVPQSPILSMPLAISHLSTVIPSSIYTTPHISSGLENAPLNHSLGSLSHAVGIASQNVSVGGALEVSSVYNNNNNNLVSFSEASSSVSSSCPVNPSLSSYPQNIPNISSSVTTVDTAPRVVAINTPVNISSLPACTVHTQSVSFKTNMSCTNPPIFSTAFTPSRPISSSIAAVAPKASTITSPITSGNLSISGSTSTISNSSVQCTLPKNKTEERARSASANASTLVNSKVSGNQVADSPPVNVTRSSTPTASAACITKSLDISTAVSEPQSKTTYAAPSAEMTTVSSTFSVIPCANALLTATASTSKFDPSSHKSPAKVNVQTSCGVSSNLSSSTCGSSIQPSPFGNCAPPLNGTTDVTLSLTKTQQTSNDAVKVSCPQSCGTVSVSDNNSGDGVSSDCDLDKKSLVMSIEKRSGIVPQSSACTPVCDVTHVIDAKLTCAERCVGKSDGPRPCLKS